MDLNRFEKETNSSNITIITVCFNAENEIEKTLKSVLSQTVTSFEYLIIDGLSRDRTVEIASSYTELFREKGIAYRIISEKDNGIYKRKLHPRARGICRKEPCGA